MVIQYITKIIAEKMQTTKTSLGHTQPTAQRFSYRKIAFIALALLCATPYVSAPVALVMGFVFTFIFGHPMPRFSSRTTSWLLKGSVVGLGFGMNAAEAMSVGKEGFVLTLCSITVVLSAGYFIGRAMGINRRMAHLISSGTAICGGSAIAAVAPSIEAKDEEISVSLGVIFLLNSVALLVFPVLGHFLGLSEYQFGLWSAMAIQDTSSVVGAASVYGEEALAVATTVKLTRALWIIPVSLLSVFLFRSKRTRVSIPWFIFLFIAAMLLNSFTAVSSISAEIYSLSKHLLVVTLFLIGSGISVKALRTTGFAPIVLGVGLWLLISVLSLGAILLIINH